MMNIQKMIALSCIVTGLTFTACETSPRLETGESTKIEMTQTETNHTRLAKAIPPPQLQTSLERKNLVKRLEHLNREGQVSYIYLISYGKVMAFYTVSGKISSLNSYLTTPIQIVADPQCHVNQGCNGIPIPSPDFDGSYGKNDDGVFFFTTEGAYVEWKGEYLWADQPLKVVQPPELVVNLVDKKADSNPPAKTTK